MEHPGKRNPKREATRHEFDDNGVDGYNPYSSLIFDALGNLYGTTEVGGAYGYGTVFEITPQSPFLTGKSDRESTLISLVRLVSKDFGSVSVS